jgi:hypothetical protein
MTFTAQDPLDELVNQIEQLDPFLRRRPLLVMNVDRNRSRHQAHPLSSTPGGKWTVVVYDRAGKSLLAYPNIHAPKAYINKIRFEHPGCHLCYMLTTTYEKKMIAARGM